MPDDSSDPYPAMPSDLEVKAVVDEFGGDPWEAVRALLHDLETLAGDYEASVSHGFVRGELPRVLRHGS